MKKDNKIYELGDAIRLERLRRKWSQEELADKSGVCQSQHISRIERGAVDMQISTLFAILRALDCKLEDLIDLNGGK